MGTFLGRLCPRPLPWDLGGQLGARLAHQLVRQRHPQVPAPPSTPRPSRTQCLPLGQPRRAAAFLRLCFSIQWALCVSLRLLTSFCRRCRQQRAPGQSRPEMPEPEGEPRAPEGQVDEGRGHEDEDGCPQKPQACVRSSCRGTDAITSSYSSTRGFPPVERRRRAASCRARPSPGPSETVRQQAPEAPPSSGQRSLRKSQPDQGPGDRRGQDPPPSPRNRSPARDRPRRRRFPLLPRRRGEPLRLPPAPQPGYRVTAEDVEAERRALWQRISRALWAHGEASSACGAPEPRRPPPQPVPRTAPATVSSSPSPTSLPGACAVSAGPSACPSPRGMAPRPVSNTEVTPMDTSPPDSTPVSGAPRDPRGGTKAAPTPAQAPASAPGLSALGTITPATSGTQTSTRPALAATGPSGAGTQGSGGSLGRNGRKRTRQGSLLAHTGPSAPQNPVLGGSTAFALTPILSGGPKHGSHPSGGGLGTGTSNAASSGVSVPAFTPHLPCPRCGHSVDW
ncbi:putative POM121-like protein 1 [Pteronotus mesoamericanus]|uniref:putative POM121-like protein 1 n=1 Tax=Pteronotus mesoamericanus TaxID=1884717 RepID=UPI0023ECD0EB|nr:putative POM121-like protein 1 [Pteronotus parnellii mesoamericanus]